MAATYKMESPQQMKPLENTLTSNQREEDENSSEAEAANARSEAEASEDARAASEKRADELAAVKAQCNEKLLETSIKNGELKRKLAIAFDDLEELSSKLAAAGAKAAAAAEAHAASLLAADAKVAAAEAKVRAAATEVQPDGASTLKLISATHVVQALKEKIAKLEADLIHALRESDERAEQRDDCMAEHECLKEEMAGLLEKRALEAMVMAETGEQCRQEEHAAAAPAMAKEQAET